MASTRTAPPPAPKIQAAPPGRLLMTFAVSLFGLAVSVYLLFGYLQLTEIGCTDTGCDLVRQWHDAHFPRAFIPAVGSLYFLALGVITVLTAFSDAKRSRQLATASMALGVAGALTVIGLTLVEATTLHAYCFWCLMIALSTLAFAVLSFKEWRMWRKGSVRYDLDFEPFVKWGLVPVGVVFLIASGMNPHSAPSASGSNTPVNDNAPASSNTPLDANTPATTTGTTSTPPDTILTRKILIRPGAHVTGPENAPVTIVEFADPGCPHCAHQMPIMDALAKKYPTEVQLVYRHFPLRSHVDSPLASEAMEAAAAQGKFKAMRDMVLMNIGKQKETDLVGYAQRIGLDVARFKKDLDTHHYKARVDQDRADGDQIGVRSTPTIIINGQRLGPASFELLDAAVKQQLSLKK